MREFDFIATVKNNMHLLEGFGFQVIYECEYRRKMGNQIALGNDAVALWVQFDYFDWRFGACLTPLAEALRIIEVRSTWPECEYVWLNSTEDALAKSIYIRNGQLPAYYFPAEFAPKAAEIAVVHLFTDAAKYVPDLLRGESMPPPNS